MSNIIKAELARFCRQESLGVSAASVSAPEAPAGPTQEEREEMERQVRQEYETAYGELLLAAQDEAAMILADARKEAGKTLAEARRQVESLRQEAYDEGFEQGLDAAKKTTEDILRKADEDAQELLESARGERDAMLDEMEPKILHLALEVAEKIMRYELDHNDGAYMTILTAALGAIKAESNVILRVNPAEYVRYFNSRDSAKIRTANGNLTAQVMIDSSVETGGCLIETDSGVIDCGLSAQIAQIENGLGLEP